MKSIIIISILRDLAPPSPTPGTSCLCRRLGPWGKLIKQISKQLAVKYRLGSHAAELVNFKPLSQWLLVVGVSADTYEVNQSMVRFLEELKDKTECEPGPHHTGAALEVLGPDLHILHSAALAPAGAHLLTQARLQDHGPPDILRSIPMRLTGPALVIISLPMTVILFFQAISAIARRRQRGLGSEQLQLRAPALTRLPLPAQLR